MVNTSDDDELEDWNKKNMDFVDGIYNSKNEVDLRLLQVFKLSRHKERENVDLQAADAVVAVL